MRIAIVSDIHANLTAFEAVLADLRLTSPDLVLHGGDVADGGSSPVEIVDRLRELGWPGVAGNTDEMLFAPESFDGFRAQSPPAYQPLLARIGEMAEFTRAALGPERLAWLKALPRTQEREGLALVHALRDNLWRAPGPEVRDQELESGYAPLGRPVVAYAHIHRPFVRRLPRLTVANTGSVGLPYDGDPRASYLLVEPSGPVVRRVEYDVVKEADLLRRSGLPHAGWVAKTLESGTFLMP